MAIVQSCSNCFFARTDTFIQTTGTNRQATETSLACHFWPPQAPETTDSTVSTWRKCVPTGWCGQWAGAGGANPGFGISTTGPQGIAGPTGATGATGVTGATGSAGLNGAGYDATTDTYRDRLTTTNAVTSVLRSIPMPLNSHYFIDSVVMFMDSAGLLGGYQWITISAARGPSGAPFLVGTVDLLESHSLAGPAATFVPNAIGNTIDLQITGKALTSVGWTARTIVDRG